MSTFDFNVGGGGRGSGSHTDPDVEAGHGFINVLSQRQPSSFIHRYDGFFFLSAFKAEIALTDPNRTLAVTVMLRGRSLIL